MLGGLLFSWVTPLVRRGAADPLGYDDLLPLPEDTTPQASTSVLWKHWTQTCVRGQPSLLRALRGAYGGPFYRLAFLKLLNDSLTFAGTMLLNLLVQHLEQAQAAAAGSNDSNDITTTSSSISGCSLSSGGSGLGAVVGVVLPVWCGPGSVCWGYVLAGLLGSSVVAKALISSHYNYRLSLVTIRLRSGVMGVLFRASLLSRPADASSCAAGDLNTLMAVDAGRLANLGLSLQELWSLPLQILAAMALLYMQVRTAFIAGVLLCVALIPINRLIAQRIQAASVAMMSAKDARVSLLGELLRHLATVKALGWEEVLRDKVLGHRRDELRALAVRKYLDALCVYFWAATQLLLSGTTFGLMVLLGQPLRPSVVFTSLALFNVLIAPLNAFPWVVNGVVEALVSLRRIQTYLLLPQRCPHWAYPPALLPSILAAQHRQQQQQQQQQLVVAAADGGDSSSKGRRGCCGWGAAGKGHPKQQQQEQQQEEQGLLQQQQQLEAGGCVWVSAGGAEWGGSGVAPHTLDSFAAVQFCDASFAWKRGQVPCLHELRLSIPAGCLTAVVGEVGSGKSSLLSAILGELDIVAGHALLPPHGIIHQQQQQHQQHQQQHQQHQQNQQAQGQAQSQSVRVRRIGYVSQSPWLLRGSVRDNVLLGQPYEAELMGEIYHAVGLDTDLAAMPAGDLSPVGEGGSGLSGGQRLRVCLARALYQPATRLFLFDDILASLDSHVSQWIIRHTLFGGLLSGATVVIVTKHPAVIQAAQLVVALQHGRVVFTGSPAAYANWKAQQSQKQQGQGQVGTGNGWTPLVRHTVPPSQHGHPRQLHTKQQQQQEPAVAAGGGNDGSSDPSGSPMQLHTPHPDLADVLSPTYPPSPPGPTAAEAAAAGTAAIAAAAAAEISLASEDVPVSELLLAGGHGVWAPHASLAPQLNAISEEAGSSIGEQLESIGSSGVLLDGCGSSGGGSSDGSWEVLAAPGGDSGAYQQQHQEVEGVSGDGSSAAAAAAAQAGATAAAAAAAESQLGSRPRSQTRRVSFSADVLSPDDDPQQQQQQQQQQQLATQQGSQQPPPPQQQQQAHPQLQQQDNSPAAAADVGPAASSSPDPDSGGCCGDDEEARGVGAVGWGVYGAYFRAVGLAMCCAVLGSLIAMQATKNGVDLWVTSSLAHNTSETVGSSSSSTVIFPSFLVHSSSNNSSISGSWSGLVMSSPSTSMLLSASVAASLAAAGGPAAAAASATAAAPGLQSSSYAAAAAAANGRQAGTCQSTRNSRTSSSNDSVSSKGSSSSRSRVWAPKPSRKLLLQHMRLQPQPQPPSWLRWQPAPLDPGMVYFLKGLGIISALNTLATLARAFSFAAAGMSAARAVHARLLGAVLAAPLAAFDAQPAGRLLNRFSSDTSVVDDSLPFILNILLANAVSLAGLLAVLLYSQPLLGLLLLPLGVVYRRLQLFYRSSARELRRLETQGLSPLYTLYGDTAAGADSLRAAAAQGVFVKRFLAGMAPYQAACVSNAAASNWLSLRLQLLAAVLLSAVAALAAMVAAATAADAAAAAGGPDSSSMVPPGAFAQWDLSSSSGSSGGGWGGSSGSSWVGGRFRIDLLGLALAYCLPIVNLLNGLLTSSAETEQDMVAVERIAALLDSLGPEGEQQQQRSRRLPPPGSSSSSALLEPLLPQQNGVPQQQQQQRAVVPTGRGLSSVSAAGAAGRQQQQQQQQQWALELVDVVMRYRPGLPPALRGVSLSVPVGHKLGVCGRTGAGKSSLLSVLLRLRPIESGAIRVLGTDSSAMSLRELRSHFAVVPQQPVLFCGSLRENLDPWGRATDEQLAATLQAVHMWAPLCRIALHRKLLGHSTYLMARRAGSIVTPGFRATTPAGAAAAAAAAAAAGGGAAARMGLLQRSSSSHQQEQPPSSAAPTTQAPAAAPPAAAAAAGAHEDPHEAEVAAIAAAWSSRRRATPLMGASFAAAPRRSSFDQGDGSAAGGEGGAAAAVGQRSSFDAAVDVLPLNARLLEEGCALALGAAAGATTAAAVEAQALLRRRSSNSSTQATAGAAAGAPNASRRLSSLKARVLDVAKAVVGSPRLVGGPLGEVFGRRASDSQRRRSAASSEGFVLPPVPMHPADKVLSMQVGGPSGLCLSSGQAQLVCVARCLLSGAPLVLLDEATAAVDTKTAGLLHQVLHEQFDTLTSRTLGGSSSSSTPFGSAQQQQQQQHHRPGHQHASVHTQTQQRQRQQWWWQSVPIRPTVIQIAHELSAISGYDTVAVMAGGQVVELGSPQELAAVEGSRFSRLRAQEGR